MFTPFYTDGNEQKQDDKAKKETYVYESFCQTVSIADSQSEP